MKGGIYEALAIKFDRTHEEERVISAQRNLDLGPVSQKVKQLLRLLRTPIGRALATSLVLIVLLTACGGEAINPETEVTTVPITEPTVQPTKTATAEPSATPEATSTPTAEEYLRNVFNFPSHIKIINGTDVEVEALKEIEGLQEDGLYQWEHRFVSEGATLVLKIDQHGRPYFLLEEGSFIPLHFLAR